MQVGEFRIDPVVDGSGRFAPTASYRATDEQDWTRHRDLLDAEGRLAFTVGGLLARGPDRTILVDAGLGARTFFGMRGGAFLDELFGFGVRTRDITDVIFTHLHLDHLGWAVTNTGGPTFARATYRCASADWRHFVDASPDGVEARLLAPIRERFEMWDGATEIAPGVGVEPAPGHTPGTAVIEIGAGNDRAVLLGDVAHSPVELLDDGWIGLGDVDEPKARRVRNSLVRGLVADGVPVVGAHFPELGFGRIEAEGSGRRWRRIRG